MNYCSINEAWEITKSPEENNLLDNQIENFEENVNSKDCNCEKLIEQILKCPKCQDIIYNMLVQNKYQFYINYLINIILKNRDIIVIILILLFILLLFNLVGTILNTIFV